MDLEMQLYAAMHTSPDMLVSWLHTLIDLYNHTLPWPSALIIGPHTFHGDAPALFETVALYRVDKRIADDIAARQVVLALTYMPLHHPGIGLDLRVWSSFPAALDTLKYHFFEYFTQANPVLTSAAALHFSGGVPPLACNRWLQARLAASNFSDAEASIHLYTAWLEQYRALRGNYPADPRRAFRAQLAKSHRHRS
jgi:hypothetical protein